MCEFGVPRPGDRWRTSKFKRRNPNLAHEEMDTVLGLLFTDDTTSCFRHRALKVKLACLY